MARFRPPRDIPDIGPTGPLQARFKAWLRSTLVEIAEDMAALGRDSSDTLIAQETIDVDVPSLRRVTPPVGGMGVRLPPPSAENAGKSVRLMIEAPVGELTVVSRPGIGDDGKVFQPTVNGEPRATFSVSGLVTLTSNGVNDWKTDAEFPAESPTVTDAQEEQAGIDATYHLAVAHPDLPNARVADDSTEISVDNTSPGLVSWFLNTASVAFSKLNNLAGLSVLGRSASSSGVMAAITSTAGYQALRSNATGTSIGWENYLPTSHIPASISGLQNPYLLPAGFAHGDTLRLTITADTTIRAILDSTGTRDTLPEGFEFNLCLSDQSGGSAPGWFLDIEDNVAITGLEGFFRTPGQVQGTSPGPSYRMRSEEEGCRVAMQLGNWRIIGGTAGQAITGAITVASGNGSTRTSTFSGIRDNGVLETARGFLNFRDSNSLSAFVVQDAGNDEMEVTFGRNALTGDVTAAFDSGVTAIAAGVIVDADVNASAAIAMTKTGALTGFAAKASGSAATTSAEPIVTYSASANMSAERVTTSSTSITVSTSIASQIEFQRAALTGAIAATANSNATLFAGIRDNGSAENDRTNLNFLNSSTISLTVTDDSGNDELEITADVTSLPSATVTPTMVAVFGTPTNTGVTFVVYVSYAAGAGGSADDVTVFNASAPFAFRILEAWQVTATAVALATVQARSASGGAGSALTTAMLASVTGKTSDNSTATTTVAASGSVFLRRSDSGVAGEFFCLCVRT